jgi:para-nitrobenzyl esterase
VVRLPLKLGYFTCLTLNCHGETLQKIESRIKRSKSHNIQNNKDSTIFACLNIMMREPVVLLRIFTFLVLPVMVYTQQTTPEKPVKTESGLVSGYFDKTTGIRIYKGIPFAAPPVGDMRWKAPAPALSWNGIKDCSKYAASPMQPKPVSFFMIGPEFVVPQSPISEDCLYLNIWTGARSQDDLRPVLVWIYGGGFMTGGAAAPGYSGEALAKQGIIFVSFNYRLGVFGFLAHPELTAESEFHSSGNYALLDQIAALKWVKNNIRAFGGDPDKVTIAGQSAGAASVNCLLSSPLARGLFTGAIAESGSLVLENPFLYMKTLADAEKQGIELQKKLNVKNLKELRNTSAEDLQKSGMNFYSPIVDGHIMPISAMETYRRGLQIHVPFLTGWNADEGLLFGFANKEDFAKQAAEFGSDSDMFKKYFPSGTDSVSQSSQVSFSVYKTIGVSQYIWAIKQNEKTNAKTYLYQFERKPPAEGNMKKFGAYHTAEIGYALNNLDSIHRNWEPVDRSLAIKISSMWVQFVKTGNPNTPEMDIWPAFSNASPQAIYFGETIHAKPLAAKAALDLIYVHYPGKQL